MLPTVYLNGQYLPREWANLNVSDLSILRGYGVFDYFRYVDGAPRFVDDHLARFARSAGLLGLELPIEGAGLRQVIDELIERNGKSEGGIRFVLTGGYAEDGYTPTLPNLVGMAYPFVPPPPERYATGCRTLLHDYERQLPAAKTIDYLEGIRLQPTLRKAGAHYPLYVDRNGKVRESDRSNFMIVKDGVLITPVEDVLRGVTRRHLLLLAHSLGIPTEERAVSTEELLAADEAIICSSVKGVLPIVSADGLNIGNGKPGPLTRRLMIAWTGHVAA